MSDVASKVFSMNDLEVFRRPGAIIGASAWDAGCRVTMPGVWQLLVRWGTDARGSNYGISHMLEDEWSLTAELAEIAVFHKGKPVRWADGDSVQGWCSMEHVQRVLDLLVDGRLVRTVEVLVADDDV